MKLFLKILAIFTLTVSVVGCSSVNSEEPLPQDSGRALYLSLNVIAAESGEPSAASRADDSYSFNESPINTEKLHSLRVIIVNLKTGEIVHNRPKTISSPETMVNNDFSDPELQFEVEFSTPYAIYLIGNESGLSTSVKEELEDPKDVRSLEDLPLSSTAAGAPVIDNSNNVTPIPMAEKFEITTIPYNPNTSISEPVKMKESFFLTRALSKFTFNFYKNYDIENVAPVYVKKVKITGLGKEEYLFPRNTYDPAKNEISSNQYGRRIITDFSLPEVNVTGSYEFTLPEFGDVADFPGWANPAPTTDKTYSPQLYFTESLGSGKENEKFQCAISFDGENYTDPVWLPNLPSLPRNTHVVVNIAIGNHNDIMDITATVKPWVEKEPLFLDYTKTVYVAPEGKLLWDDGTCQSNSNGKVIMKEWTSRVITDEDGVEKIVKDPVPLEGKFLIQTPEGATWTAYLIPIAGQYGDAFAFQDIDEDGKYITDDGKPRLVSSVSGRIKEYSINETPEFSNLKIYTLQDKPESNVANRAYLQVIVTIENGGMTSVVEAPVNPDGITRYEIIQNP